MTALEHTLILLLLLTGLLNARRRLPLWAQWAIGGGLALAFVVPPLSIVLPWDWLSALVIPLLLWQAAQRLISARWPVSRADVALWLWMTLGVGGVLNLTADLPLPGAFTFGLLAASMMWRATEDSARPSHLGQIGPLALAFLLVEIAPAVEFPDRYALALIGGATLGAVIGYTGVHAAERLSVGLKRDATSIGQVYLAYGTGVLFGISGVAAAVMSVAVYVAYGARRGLWASGAIRPTPLNSGPILGLAVVALAFFGWQTHVPLTLVLLIEVGLGLLVTALAIWVGRLLKSPTFYIEGTFVKVLWRVGLLLVPALLLWPRQVQLEPEPLAFALAAAGLATLGTHLALTPLLSLYAWLDEAGAEAEEPDQLVNTLLVRDLMTREIVTVPPDTPVPEIARLLSERAIGCVPVVEADGRLVGIVTESDLFVKQERLPRTGRTYPALFKEPITPELLPQVYADLGARHVAADAMTRQVVWVKDTHSVGRAVRVMVQFGYKRLPVLTADPAAGGRLVGILARADIVRLLAGKRQ
jgi:CBS domain-containing protein